jgi:hypothetical protein
MKVYLSTLLLLLITSLFVRAQTGVIKSKITDNDNLSIVGAAVCLKAHSKAVVTNNKGEFVL